MPTALTLLFPDGYAVRADPVAGTIDTCDLLDPVSGATSELDGTLSSCGTLHVRGWGFDAVRALPGAGVIITLGDAVAEALYGELRSDIGDVYGSSSLIRTGFVGAISPAPAARGALTLRAHLVSSDAREITPLAGAREIQVVAGDAELSFAAPVRAGFATVHVDAWRPVVANGLPSHPDRPLVVERGTLVMLTGWAIDAEAQRPLRGVSLIVDERDTVRGTIGRHRDDVATALGSEALRPAGFEIRFDTAGLPAGLHRLQLGVTSWDGTAHDRIPLVQRLEILPVLRP